MAVSESRNGLPHVSHSGPRGRSIAAAGGGSQFVTRRVPRWRLERGHGCVGLAGVPVLPFFSMADGNIGFRCGR
jgi:hypothetical protein